jgi:hypothetical protein
LFVPERGECESSLCLRPLSRDDIFSLEDTDGPELRSDRGNRSSGVVGASSGLVLLLLERLLDRDFLDRDRLADGE